MSNDHQLAVCPYSNTRRSYCLQTSGKKKGDICLFCNSLTIIVKFILYRRRVIRNKTKMNQNSKKKRGEKKEPNAYCPISDKCNVPDTVTENPMRF